MSSSAFSTDAAERLDNVAARLLCIVTSLAPPTYNKKHLVNLHNVSYAA